MPVNAPCSPLVLTFFRDNLIEIHAFYGATLCGRFEAVKTKNNVVHIQKAVLVSLPFLIFYSAETYDSPATLLTHVTAPPLSLSQHAIVYRVCSHIYVAC